MSTGGLALYWNLTALTSAHTLNARARVSLMPCRKFQGTSYHADFKFHVIGMCHHLFGEPRRKRCFLSKRSSLLFWDEVLIFISISYSLGIRSYSISRCLEMRGFHWKRFVVALVNNIIIDKKGTSRRTREQGERGGESTKKWPGFDSVLDAIRVLSLLVLFSALKGFSLGTPFFLSLQWHEHITWFDLTKLTEFDLWNLLWVKGLSLAS